MNDALDGVLVVDLTRVLAGPYATMMLADLGARVIKVEPPEGDGTRGLGPPLDADRSAYFVATNRGKQSLVLDLARPEGREVLLDLVARADVLVENFRPGVLERLVLPAGELARRFPRLVVCSLSAFGWTGPERDQPAFDLTIQARGGGMSVTGHPGAPPARMGFPMGDLGGALFASTAILAALVARTRTGRGDHLDVALLDTQAALLSYFAQYHLAGASAAGPAGSGHPSAVPYRVYPTARGDLAIAVFLDRFWPPLCAALDDAALAHDPELRTAAGRLRRRDEVDGRIARALARDSAAAWHARLRAAGVPSAPLQDVGEVLADPQLRARGVVVPGDDGVPLIASPLRSLHRPQAHTARRHAPHLAEHGAQILQDLLGYAPDRVADLLAKGVLGRPAR